nr:MAG TPA: hypothetical protein [Caudoviricetes sp.]
MDSPDIDPDNVLRKTGWAPIGHHCMQVYV